MSVRIQVPAAIGPIPTRKIRVLVYILSSAIDMVSGTILFATPIRATFLGASYSLIGMLGVSWALGSVASTFLLGRFVTPARCVPLCVGACILQASAHVGLALSSSAEGMIPFLVLCGAMHSAFFVPYQLFFKAVDAGARLPLAKSIGVYTFAWSLGLAVGPLWSGFLMGKGGGDPVRGWVLSLVFTIIASLFVATAMACLRRYASAGHAFIEAAPRENKFPDFSRLAWIAILCGVSAATLVRVLFPAGGVRLGISEEAQGGVVFLAALVQALTGLALVRVTAWMYRPLPILVTGLAGACGLGCFVAAFSGAVPAGWTLWVFFLGAFLFGIYAGAFYSYIVFHALVHPTRAGFNLAVNEIMFGGAHMIGGSLGGLLADTGGIYLPYLLASFTVAAFSLIQSHLHRRRHA